MLYTIFEMLHVANDYFNKENLVQIYTYSQVFELKCAN